MGCSYPSNGSEDCSRSSPDASLEMLLFSSGFCCRFSGGLGGGCDSVKNFGDGGTAGSGEVTLLYP